MSHFLRQNNSIYWLLGINLSIRLIIVISTNLGNDEVYYALYALYPDYSYFDHPPMVGFLIRLSTFNLLFYESEFFVRLGALLIGTINIYLVYRIGILMKNKSTGLIASILLSSSFYSSIVVGTFVLPDTPQSVFWLLSIFFFIQYITKNTISKPWLVFFGISVGFAMLSKYHAIFLWLGAVIYFLIYGKQKLFTIQFWIAPILTILIFSPVIWWNLTTEYSGISYHTDRIGNDSFIPTFKYLFSDVFLQIFWNNPFNVFLIVLSLFIIKKQRKDFIDPNIGFLLAVSLPLIITTIGMSLYNRTLPHWSGPSYFALILIAAHTFSPKEFSLEKKTLKRVMIYSHIYFLLVIIIGIIHIKTGVIINLTKELSKVGINDFTIEYGLWEEISTELKSNINLDIEANPKFQKHTILTHNWFPGSHLDYYYAFPNHTKLYVLGGSHKQHNYMRFNNLRGEIPLYSNAYYISTSHYFSPPETTLLERFESVEGPEIIPIYKFNKNRVNVFIWKLVNLKNNVNLHSTKNKRH